MEPLKTKVWLSSPTMHGDELKYITEAYQTNWMSTVGENILSYKEESYNIFKTKEKTSDFLDYVKEYDNYDQEKKDEDNLKIDEE